jgi:hypothetical protein
MNTSPETKAERGGFFRRLFGPSKNELHHEIARLLAQRTQLQEEKEILEGTRQADNQLIESQRQLIITIQKQRNVSWPKPAVRMPEKLVLAEFNVPIDQGYPAAVFQELDDKIQELLDLVTQPPHGTYTQKDGTTVPAFTEADRLHLAGGVEHLRLFQKQLLDLSAKANTTDADLDDDNKPAA